MQEIGYGNRQDISHFSKFVYIVFFCQINSLYYFFNLWFSKKKSLM